MADRFGSDLRFVDPPGRPRPAADSHAPTRAPRRNVHVAKRRRCWPLRPTGRWQEALAETVITNRIMHQRYAARHAQSEHRWFQVAIPPLRSQIEKVFGVMKWHYLYRRVRYLGLVRSRCQIWLLSRGVNLRRVPNLCHLQPIA